MRNRRADITACAPINKRYKHSNYLSTIGPAILKPILRAYLLGHLSSTAPRLIAALIRYHRHSQSFLQVRRTIASSLSIDKFPAFCALLTGAYSLLQLPLLYIARRKKIGTLLSNATSSSKDPALRLARQIAAFAAAFITFPLLNRYIQPKDTSYSEAATEDKGVVSLDRPVLAGRTLDLTVTAGVRAAETILRSTWKSARRNGRTGLSLAVESFIEQAADSCVFASSAGIIMWAWFYAPERLPATYNKWITRASGADPRLITALRQCRRGEWVYGMHGDHNYLLSTMASDLGLSPSLGDPARTIPISCEIVHQGAGPSCHWAAAVRFSRAFYFAAAMYLPLQIMVKVSKGKRVLTMSVFKATLREVARSSAFLGAFISIFYYSVCLSRTLLGPRLFSHKIVSPQMWDGGYAVGSGCLLCGWSVLIEAVRRRQELACFVAPRAMATILPRAYDAAYFWRERMVFAVSIAILFARAHEDPGHVRGMVGQVLHGVLA